ncbi:UV excision repair protein [Actinidia chinensis var. chinensis]|uniref:UV excision repair protein n=1 Tax=Actinidia chinensis var. chinensis TaxID=1590841 RepID=A0A2R6PBY2_ACTCC|nr:UV excision repair protein [Actinidia chinensis var. chinensis]
MEITELSLISDFEAGMNCLQNRSLISRFFSLSGFGETRLIFSFWKWGALILALVATFSGIITRIKLVIVGFCKFTWFALASSGPKTQHLEDDYLSDEDDYEDDSCSSVSSDEDEDEPTTSFHDRELIDEDFCVAGSSCYGDDPLRLRRRSFGGGEGFSWSDFAGGKTVVKLWDSFGLGLDFEDESSENEVSIWDLNKDRKTTSFSGGRCQIPAIFTSSPALIYSAGSNIRNNVLLKMYDTRIRSQIPAICAEWLPRPGKVVGIESGGNEKVYVRDDVTGSLTVGDMRNVKTPLETLTESDVDTWWDADGVIVSDVFVEDSS